MPHAAALVGGAIAFAGAAFILNEFVVQPHLERRRQAREEQEEMDRAIAMSLFEYENQAFEQQRRRENDFGPSRAWSSTPSQAVGTDSELRRRRMRAQEDDETTPLMQERETSATVSNDILFDAGPASRLDTIFAESRAADGAVATSQRPASASSILDDTASLSDDELAQVISPQNTASDNPFDDPSELADPAFGSRSGSPALSTASSFAVLEPTRANTPLSRAVSPTPSIQSITTDATLVSRPQTPSRSDAGGENAQLDSRPQTPMSGFSNLSIIIQQRDDVSRSGHLSDDSAWSDLGEDSSEDEAPPPARRAEDTLDAMRRKREEYFSGVAAAHL